MLLPRSGIELFGLTVETSWMTRAWAGALLVLFLNTAAYSAEIFYGALRAVPRGDVEAADAYGMSGWTRFRRVIWPTMLRLAWPAYTNEAIFLFHATTLVFFSSFPAWQQRGDALYYANYFADKTFNPFIPYPIVAGYFILLTLCIIGLFGLVNRRLNRHLPQDTRRAGSATARCWRDELAGGKPRDPDGARRGRGPQRPGPRQATARPLCGKGDRRTARGCR